MSFVHHKGETRGHRRDCVSSQGCFLKIDIIRSCNIPDDIVNHSCCTWHRFAKIDTYNIKLIIRYPREAAYNMIRWDIFFCRTRPFFLIYFKSKRNPVKLQTNKPLQISLVFANQVLRKMIFLNDLNGLPRYASSMTNVSLAPILSWNEILVIDKSL